MNGLPASALQLKRIILCTIVLLWATTASFGQNEANWWFFGNGCGLDFSGGNAVAVTGGQINTFEGVATISDGNGNLLFYSDGITIWNANHAVMPNGTGLHGNSSSTQSAVVVPKPGSSNIYYLFTVSPWAGGLKYSEIDMSLAGGLGDVTTNKNIVVQSNTTEKITAVQHANGSDYWVIGHELNSNAFKAYQVTSAGPQIASPITTSLGTVHGDGVGYMKTSSDGTKLALCVSNFNNLVEIFDFDANTGVFSNNIVIQGSGLGAPYGIEFSPNNQILYVSEWGFEIYQYDLTQPNAAAMIANQYVVNVSGQGIYGALQLGSDGVIYANRAGMQWLGTISDPDVLGSGCTYTHNGVGLLGAVSQYGLPTFVQSFFAPSVTIAVQDTCLGDSTFFDLTLNVVPDSVLWNFDDPASGANNTSTVEDPYHIFSDTGNYQVTLISYFIDTITNLPDTAYDTVMVGIHDVPQVNLGNNTGICDGDSLVFTDTTTILALSYLWNTGSVDSAIQVTSTGTYWLEVTTECGVSSDTIVVDTLLPAFVDFGPDSLICVGQTVLLDATTTTAVYLWQDGSTSNTFLADTTGTYWAEASGACGTSRDTIDLTFIDPPVINFSSDTILCDGQTHILSASGDFTTYLWHNGNINANFSVNSPGTYWVAATNVCGTFSDTVTFKYDYTLNINLGGDTVVCVGNSYVLDPATGTNGTTTHLWHNNSTDSTFTVFEDGLVWLEATNLCGVFTDSVLVEYEVPPVVDLGRDLILCTGNTVNLDATFSRSTYTWNTGASTPMIDVTISGTYSVQVTNLCGTDDDEVTINFDFPLTVDLGEDLFLCDGDEWTLDATAPNNPTYIWNTSSPDPIITVTESGRYAVSATNTCGDFTDEIVIEFIKAPLIGWDDQIVVCEGESLVLEVEERDNATTHLWNDGSALSFLTVTKPGRYWLEASNECGTDRDQVTVLFQPLPVVDIGPDTFVCNAKGPVELDAFVQDATYQWQDGASSALYQALEPGFYTVLVKDQYECASVDEIHIDECPVSIWLPTAFTPDNDGINDIFKAKGENIVEFSLRIYNRWGQLIFHTADINDGWDGRIDGNMAPAGTYSYKVFTKGDNLWEETTHGFFNLLK